METGKGPETPGKASSKARLGNRWRPGVSGNPQGYRKGSRHKSTLFAQALLDGEVEHLVRTVVEAAKNGDMAAMRLCLERLCAPIKSRPIQFKLPALRTISDALSAMTLIIDGAARGEILADEAQALSELVGNFVRAIEVNELETRLAALERASGEESKATASHYDA
jgi:Family of unknown function (DUF5681)